MSKDLIFVDLGAAIFVYLSIFIPFVFPSENIFLQLMETKVFGELGLSHLSNFKFNNMMSFWLGYSISLWQDKQLKLYTISK